MDGQFDSGTGDAALAAASATSPGTSAPAAASRAAATSPPKRAYTPQTYPPSRRAGHQPGQLQANGKKAVTCGKCGFVGGNARGCGTAHEPMSRVADGEPQTDEKLDRRALIKTSAKRRDGTLPAVSSSFDVDHETGEVRELDFGGDGG